MRWPWPSCPSPFGNPSRQSTTKPSIKKRREGETKGRGEGGGREGGGREGGGEMEGRGRDGGEREEERGRGEREGERGRGREGGGEREGERGRGREGGGEREGHTSNCFAKPSMSLKNSSSCLPSSTFLASSPRKASVRVRDSFISFSFLLASSIDASADLWNACAE